MKLLITGADGFIGSEFVRRVADKWIDTGINTLTAVTHGSSEKNQARLQSSGISGLITNGVIEIRRADLTGEISGLCEGIDVVINFAAKTFVDHSIRDPEPFTKTNVLGTQILLEEARRSKVKRFFQISTDEVYGSIHKGAYKEDAPIRPSNPYSASKAAADALVQSYGSTYGMHVTITRTENNYGPFQHPQKVFPTFIRNILLRNKLPMYGDGSHVRQWLHVSDHVEALLFLLKKDYPSGQIFHVAGNQELTNHELGKRIFEVLRKDEDYEANIEYLNDHEIRPGHDRRYALDSSKLRRLGWTPVCTLDAGIPLTVEWYRKNRWWNR